MKGVVLNKLPNLVSYDKLPCTLSASWAVKAAKLKVMLYLLKGKNLI